MPAQGSKFPAVRELALEAGVNPNTMQRALAELEREGLLMTVRTSGRLVTGSEERLRTLRMELGNSVIGEMFINLRRLGLSDGEKRSAAGGRKRGKKAILRRMI